MAFKQFVERYKIDTTYLTKTRIAKNYIYLCTAIDDVGRKHVMVDADNNRDFRNDKELIFDLNKRSQPLPAIKANIDYYDGKAIRTAKALIQIDPYNPFFPDTYYKSEMDKKLDVTIGILQRNKVGTFAVDDQSFKINILNFDERHPKSPFKINIQKLPFSEKNNNDYLYKNTDTLEIAGNLYTTQISPDADFLVLNFIEKGNNYGAETGTMAPALSLTDLRTNLPFSLRSQRGKYIMVDFWGSWCGPCIRLIPELKKIHSAYKDKMQFISIAYDKPHDLPKLKKLIEENQMSWIQLMDDKNVKNGVIEKYKVDEFPTCLLIDTAGKILYRGTGSAGLKKLIAYYDNLVKQEPLLVGYKAPAGQPVEKGLPPR